MGRESPLVSIVCLCYNHRPYLRRAIESVIQQSYSPLQIIVADDGSTDGSREEINRLKDQYPFLEVMLLPENLGNCRAFNKAFKQVRGKYIIDFATDDVMMPDRIEKQVHFFETLGDSVGVVFTDAEYIDQNNRVFRRHYDYLFSKGLLKSIPQGDVYQALVSHYFVASPTMMVRTKVLTEMGGYDEALAYEDFDFWVRSSRNYHYAFLNEILTQIRRKHASLSTGLYQAGDEQLLSTYKVCKKIQVLNRSEGDRQALVTRVRYELRHAVFTQNLEEAEIFYQLLNELQSARWVDKGYRATARAKLPLNWMRTLYHRIRFGE